MERIQIELAPRDSKNLALLAVEAHKISQILDKMVRSMGLGEPESDISCVGRVILDDSGQF